jgi:hypothetical protein
MCKGCHKPIEARHLRMGVTSLSPFFDGTVVKYYHVACYFKRKRPAHIGTSKLEGFKGIQYTDQDKLRALFGEPTGRQWINCLHASEQSIHPSTNQRLTGQWL